MMATTLVNQADTPLGLKVLRITRFTGAEGSTSARRRNEETRLPAEIDYAVVAGLSNEARQRLIESRPGTLGQASRLPGITAATISILLVHLKKRARAA